MATQLSDGSDDWIINLHIITEPSNNSPLPPEGFLTIDLRISRTYQVLYFDEHGNPSCFQELGPSHTMHFPGTMTRAQYSSALLHHWLECFRLNQLRLDTVTVRNFTNHVIDCVFATTVNNLHNKLAIRVTAELCRVSFELYSPYAPLPIDQSEQDNDEDDDETEEYEKDEGLPEYCVEALIDYYEVVAAEKHHKFGDCSICLDCLFPVEEEGKKSLFGSPCGHFFHGKCMNKWLRMSDSCPLCRFVMSSVIEE